MSAGNLGQLTNLFGGDNGGSPLGAASPGFTSQVASMPESSGALSGAYSRAQSAGSLATAGGPMGAVNAGTATAGQIGQMTNLLSSTSSVAGANAMTAGPGSSEAVVPGEHTVGR